MLRRLVEKGMYSEEIWTMCSDAKGDAMGYVCGLQ